MAEVIRPIQLKPISPIHINERSEMMPLKLANYITNPKEESSLINYDVTLSDGKALPMGIVIKEGVISGQPAVGSCRNTPYQVRVVAKNRTAVPLVVRFELYIHESSALIGESEQGADSNEAVLPENIEELMAQQGLLSDKEFNELFLLYMLQKWGSICIFNASNNAQFYNETLIYEGSSGWMIYDDGGMLRTTNPKAVSTTFSSSGMIETLKEIIAIAAGRSWERAAVRGCALGTGYQLIREHNIIEMKKPAEQRHTLEVDNPAYSINLGGGSPKQQKQPE